MHRYSPLSTTAFPSLFPVVANEPDETPFSTSLGLSRSNKESEAVLGKNVWENVWGEVGKGNLST